MPSLTMPLFVAPADVILRMQMSADLAGTNDLVENGIKGSQLHCERVIDGKLKRTSRTNIYHCDPDLFSGIQPGGMFRLEVPSGLIRRDTDVILSSSAASSTGPFGTFTEEDAGLYTVDYDRGYILVSAENYKNQYLKVECDTGFEDGTTPYPVTGIDAWSAIATYTVGQTVVFDGVVYTCKVITEAAQSPLTHPARWEEKYVELEQIPADLYEAIMTMVPVIFSVSQQTQKGMPDPAKGFVRAAAHAEFLLSNYTRAKGLTHRPIV